MKRVILVIITLASSVGTFAGGGWPQPKGTGYFKLAQNYIGSSSFYNPDGDIIEITRTSLYTSSAYAEYGFTNRFTGILYFPFFVRATLNEVRYNQSGKVNPGDDLNSIGDTDLSFKYGLVVNKPIVLSVTLLLGLPIGETGGGSSQILQTGDGEFNQMIRLDASHSFYPKAFYVSAYAGFNNRTQGFSDEVRFGGEIGFSYKKLIPILKLNVVQSLFNGDSEVAQNGIFSNNTEYISPTLEVNYQLTEKIGISGSGGFAIAGRNILASPNWSLGAYLKFR